MAVLTSKLIVALVDRVTNPSRAITRTIDRLNAAQARNNRRLDSIRGRMLEAGAVAYGLARAISAPVRAATDFETKLEDIGQKIDEPVAKLPKLGREIREVARATRQSAEAIADGMDVLTGMGASRNDALSLLNPIGRAATAYNAEIADLSQAGYAALDNLKVPAQEFGRALDAMATAGKAGAFELKDMAQYFPALGAGYQALGQTGVPAVADLSAALQIVRKGAGDSAEAATNLSNILQKVYAPKTIKAFKAMGVDLRKEMEKAAKLGMTPIEAITEITSRTLKGDLSRIGDLFADAQVQKGLRPLIQNIDLYRQIRAEALAAQGVVEADYERRLQTGAIATQRWKIGIEGLNLAVGNALLPALTSLANDIIPVVDAIAKWTDAHPVLTRAIFATVGALVAIRVAALAAQFSFLWMNGGLIAIARTGLRAARFLIGLLNPLKLVTNAFRILRLAVIGTGIGAIVVAIAIAGAWIYNNWSGISTAFEAFRGAFMRAIEPVMPAIQPVLDVFQWLWDRVTSLLGPIDEMGGGWAAAGIAAGKFAGDIVVALVELPGKVAEYIGQMVERLKSFGADMIDAGRALMASLLEGIKAGAQAVLDYVKGIGSRIKSGVMGAASGAWNRAKSIVGLGGDGVAGARAAGGPVRAGKAYLVGEHGPEIVTFARNAFVHSAVATARMARNAALASAVALPAAAAPAGAGSGQAPNINVGGVRIEVRAAPGQSPQEIAETVERVLSEKLTGLYNGAFHDGVN